MKLLHLIILLAYHILRSVFILCGERVNASSLYVRFYEQLQKLQLQMQQYKQLGLQIKALLKKRGKFTVKTIIQIYTFSCSPVILFNHSFFLVVLLCFLKFWFRSLLGRHSGIIWIFTHIILFRKCIPRLSVTLFSFPWVSFNTSHDEEWKVESSVWMHASLGAFALFFQIS